ncbi:ankyrin repeat domain-containing protein [Lachnobacterium bovis]|uniref:Ankyrin repeat-containing protein n=1 Tax=Lachnobacterium bovis TaxID=140626 RepID=A0A1H9Q9S8_9FIRM|nr:ankyrin repeat domain-containing protein [Lachnobacterium bovis]SER56905.1 Ankyrin repeat-containing protein [Lachnobacterium bovis]
MGDLYRELELIEKIKKLKESGVDLDKNDNENRQTALHILVKKDNLIGIRVMLREGVNMEKQDINGCTPLCIAAMAGNVNAVKILIDHGANPNVVCKRIVKNENVDIDTLEYLEMNEQIVEDNIFCHVINLAKQKKNSPIIRSRFLSIAKLMVLNGLDLNDPKNKEAAKGYKSIQGMFV